MSKLTKLIFGMLTFNVICSFSHIHACNDVFLYKEIVNSPKIQTYLNENFTPEAITNIDRWILEESTKLANKTGPQVNENYFELNSVFHSIVDTVQAVSEWKKDLANVAKDDKSYPAREEEILKLEDFTVELIWHLREISSRENMPSNIRPIEKPKSSEEILKQQESDFYSRVANSNALLKEHQNLGPIFRRALFDIIDKYFDGTITPTQKTLFANDNLFLEFHTAGQSYRLVFYIIESDAKNPKQPQKIHIVKVGPRGSFYKELHQRK